MTGFGRAEGSKKGAHYVVELSAVNRKHFDLHVNLPKFCQTLESRVQEEVNKVVHRGRLTGVLRVTAANVTDAKNFTINATLAKRLNRSLGQLAKEVGVNNDLSLSDLIRFPDIVQLQNKHVDADALWPQIKVTLRAALQMLDEQRQREGAHLEKALSKILGQIEKTLGELKKNIPAAKKKMRQRMKKEVTALTKGQKEDHDRILREVAIVLIRSDIEEELTRMESHCEQWRKLLKQREPVGRRLDFLAQEMMREANTMSAKADDVVIARNIFPLKQYVDQLKEQALNIE